MFRFSIKFVIRFMIISMIPIYAQVHTYTKVNWFKCINSYSETVCQFCFIEIDLVFRTIKAKVLFYAKTDNIWRSK